MREFASILPSSPHDAERLARTHPSEYRNPQPAPRYNLVILGAGSAGLITAAIAAGLGARVALVERDLLGGDCLNVGCVPSKAVIHGARVAAGLDEARTLGLALPEGAELDFAAAMERMRRVRAEISAEDSVARYGGDFGVDVFLGQGRFDGDERVVVERDGEHAELRFARAVIATGARAARPPIPGLDEVGYRTNETIFNLTQRPGRLAVIGGGPIGCELAQAFQRYGSQVTLIDQAEHFLVREDSDAAELLQGVFRREGVELALSTTVERVERKGDEAVLYLKGPNAGSLRELVVDEILVGVGRQPNVDGLGLETAGVDFDARRGVVVDDRLRTTNRRIYAAGDICMRWKFTHAADAAAKIVVQNALFFGRKKLSQLVMPWCTYTSPEIAHVGLYPHQASERGVEIDTYRVALDENNRAVADGEAEGFVKVHTARGKDRIVGATIVAAHAGDLISQVTQAMVHGVGLAGLGDVIFPYPTQAEALKRAAGAYTRTRLTPTVARLFERWLAFRR